MNEIEDLQRLAGIVTEDEDVNLQKAVADWMDGNRLGVARYASTGPSAVAKVALKLQEIDSSAMMKFLQDAARNEYS